MLVLQKAAHNSSAYGLVEKKTYIFLWNDMCIHERGLENYLLTLIINEKKIGF